MTHNNHVRSEDEGWDAEVRTSPLYQLEGLKQVQLKPVGDWGRFRLGEARRRPGQQRQTTGTVHANKWNTTPFSLAKSPFLRTDQANVGLTSGQRASWAEVDGPTSLLCPKAKNQRPISGGAQSLPAYI